MGIIHHDDFLAFHIASHTQKALHQNILEKRLRFVSVCIKSIVTLNMQVVKLIPANYK